MKISLKDVLNNPHRDLMSNPLNEEKIEKLRSSIQDTGFWDNVLVRKSEEHPGKFEIAYGHHRVEAARREKMAEADFIVKKLSYDMMLEVMSRENDEAYGNDLRTTIESVSALVKAVASGKIDAKKIAPDEGQGSRPDTYRYAPSFVVGKRSGSKFDLLPYTPLSLGKFLGFTKVKEGEKGTVQVEEKVTAALVTLEMQEAKIWTKADLGKFRTEDGVIPVDRVIKASKDSTDRNALRVKRAEIKAAQAKEAGKVLQQVMTVAQAEEKANDEERQRLIDERAADKKLKAEERVRLEAEDRKERERIAAEREVKRKEYEKEQKRLLKETAESEEAVKAAAKAAEQQTATQWVSACKTLRDKVDRLFSEEHALSVEIRTWTRDKRVTDNQRAELLLALQNLSLRAAQFSVNPTVPAKSAQGGK